MFDQDTRLCAPSIYLGYIPQARQKPLCHKAGRCEEIYVPYGLFGSFYLSFMCSPGETFLTVEFNKWFSFEPKEYTCQNLFLGLF